MYFNSVSITVLACIYAKTVIETELKYIANNGIEIETEIYLILACISQGSGKLSLTWSPGECTDDDFTPISFPFSSLPLIDRVCAAKACPGRDNNSLLRLCECGPGYWYCFR